MSDRDDSVTHQPESLFWRAAELVPIVLIMFLAILLLFAPYYLGLF